ncbi:MAG: S-methyl-5'-thioinosine phosphorylase [Gammaproteobacteria bacterium]|nr:S-methyl-5'-thioinosine phosphorylase [Gammaproteobacteria bacterium]
MRHLAIIVGSGALELDLELAPVENSIDTAYGPASTAPLYAQTPAAKIHVLARHGVPHVIAPHEINYRANLSLLADLGATDIVAINTVGGIAAHASNGVLVFPDQIIDYSWGRAHTYSDADRLLHVDFSDPYDERLRGELLAAAAAANLDVHDGGVYAATQGPRFESAAEVERMRRDGCTLVGMTGMPEAGLACELGLAYVSICVVVNPAAGRGVAIDLDAISAIAQAGMSQVSVLLGSFLQGLEVGN